MINRHAASRYLKLEDKGFSLRPLQGEGWTIDVQLDYVQELGERNGLSCYALQLGQYAGPAYAPQGVYRLVHAELGDQQVLVVPLGSHGKARMRYEVVFN